MGSVNSYLSEDTDGTDEDISHTELFQSSFLPLDQRVKVHLVPKFYTSDDGSFFLFVTLKKPRNLFPESTDPAYYTASVQFRQRKPSLEDGGLSTREVFVRPPSCTGNTIEDSHVDVREVMIKKGESIRICGVFSSHGPNFVKLEQSDSFELILCPSEKITPQPEDWMLMGTLYTKPLNLKRERHWKAAVRNDFN